MTNKSCKTGEGTIGLTPEFLDSLLKVAEETRAIHDEIASKMTADEAKRIRSWRCAEQGYTWEAVADAAYESKICGGEWMPPSNKLMGIALCEKAASFFGEDVNKPPWD